MVSDAHGKKTGNQRQEDYEIEDYLVQLQPVVDALEADLPEAKYDLKSLAYLVYSILQFMEDALGINALPPKPFPKLSAQLFRDFSSDGPIFTIAKRCYEYKVRNQLKKIDFLNPQMRKSSMELINIIRQEFFKEGLISYPKVYFHPGFQGTQVAKLKENVLELKGTLAESAEEPGVTHVVHPFGDAGDPDDGQQYMRTLNVMGLQALVHWWYTPDSYDEWISRQTAPVAVEPDYDPGTPWKVYVRWVTDSVKYNEWANPIDYETEEFQEQLEKTSAHRATAALVEGSQQEGTGLVGNKREREEGEIASESLDPTEAVQNLKDDKNQDEVQAGEEEVIAPGIKRQKVSNPNEMMMDTMAAAENISLGNDQNWVLDQYLPEYQITNAEENSQGSKKIKKELYRVPAHSAWFRWDKIHEREVKSIPEYFNLVNLSEASEEEVQKSRDLYIERRNLVIDKYREAPERYLTFGMVKKQISGDVVLLKRIWDFLNSWGLINYFAKKPTLEHQQKGVELMAVSEKPSSSAVTATTFVPTPEALYRFSWPSAQEATKSCQSGANNVNLVTKQSKLAGIKPLQDKVVYYCNAMPWVNCTKLRYHCTKFPDVDLCPEAYTKGHFPPGCIKKDFVRIEDSEPSQGGEVGEWQEQETLLLLEGLELFGDKWGDVSEHVGTKSQIQCIMRFLQFPIEEQFLQEGKDEPKGVALEEEKEEYQVGTENSNNEIQNYDSAALTAAQQNAAESQETAPLPFADANNPLMAQIAFLTNMVSPKVASAAAQRALEVLSEEDPTVAEDPRNNLSSESITNTKIATACGSALSAAAVKAKLLADNEEREIQRLVVAAVDAQMKKVEIKLKHLEELEGIVEQEKNALVIARRQYETETNQLRAKHQDAQNKLQFLRQQLQQRQDSGVVVPPAQLGEEAVLPYAFQQTGQTQQDQQYFQGWQIQTQQTPQTQRPPIEQTSLSLEDNSQLNLDSVVSIVGQIPGVEAQLAQPQLQGGAQQEGQWVTVEDNSTPNTQQQVSQLPTAGSQAATIATTADANVVDQNSNLSNVALNMEASQEVGLEGNQTSDQPTQQNLDVPQELDTGKNQLGQNS